MDYGKTLHLPETEFPMRGNLPKREPEFLAFWQDHDIYHKRLEQRKNGPKFILHDGPPYANGKLHIGHALNKVLKDIVLKYKTQRGFYTKYVPGWDTHGLPIEHAVIKNTGLNRHEMTPLALRKKCHDYAMEQMNLQRQEFIRFGVLGDWENPYLTLQHHIEVEQIGVFGKMAKKGHIYKGMKTVYWCPHCETALAEAEIEYKDDKSFSLFVKFQAVQVGTALPKGADLKNVYALIWTTTPWTIPCNLAISANAAFTYVWVRIGEEYLLMAQDRVAVVMEAAHITDYEVLPETLTGEDIKSFVFRHPLYERNSPILLGEHVTLDAGTGLVHTAPDHGQDDFDVCKQSGKPELQPLGTVDSSGRYTNKVPRYEGVFVFDNNVPVIKDLAAVNALFAKETFRHQYPHCWRCKEPIIYRATEQWFSSVDGYRQEALQAIDNVQWIPAWGHDRIYNMIRDRGDWCISRQRVWGVPIPIFYCEDCGTPIINDDTISHLQGIFAKEGSDAWWAHSETELLPDGFVCPSCGGKHFRKESDIMDVWFDSGCTHQGVLNHDPELAYPCDLYLEGSDQHRGWFNSSLLTSVAANGIPPYKAVLTHGFTVDGEGRKMSKSVGNTVAPQEVIEKYGADVMRLWVSSADYQGDIRLSPKILKQLSDVYRKIRNTFRYLLGSLADFDPQRDAVAYDQLTDLDKWALMRLEEVLESVTESYETYQFHVMYHTIHNFCTIDLSAVYLDIIKDRLYTEKQDALLRRSAQTVMYEVLMTLVKITAPVLSFTAEEVWQFMPVGFKDKESVHLTDWPKAHPEYIQKDIAARWDTFLSYRQDMMRALEKARQDKTIGHALDAEVTLYATGKTYDFLKDWQDQLATLLIVSNAMLVQDKAPEKAIQGEAHPELAVVVEASTHAKCERCWTHSKTVGVDPNHPTLCARCASVLAE
ncbi:isoleucine--tRNA ligase [Megasphaera hutchinsoni]|uniref:Isoleucine--tRNA ligase n=1 Tax=Megasphaera hutchinsoni TaxID=1588748 RepID=A0A2J8BAN3_9FIRM|nr:isoleucine--tRNA ligase [Megasphaera genomosp. type_2]PNH21834.1 isoleucine--tRNA ligase [Megasphaera genomosp. type_2]